jgi:hypothetical protein
VMAVSSLLLSEWLFVPDVLQQPLPPSSNIEIW